jgi:Glycosyltransferase family 10 (fucosyltransferase) C-term
VLVHIGCRDGRQSRRCVVSNEPVLRGVKATINQHVEQLLTPTSSKLPNSTPRFHLATGPERGPFQGKYKPRATQLGIEFTWESYPMQLCRFGPHMLEPSVRQNYDMHVTYRRDADVWMPYYINAFKDYWEAHPPLPFERKRDAVVGVHSNCDGNCFVRDASVEPFLLPREPGDMKTPPLTVYRDDIVSGIVQATDLPFHFYGKCMSNQPGWLPRDRAPKIHFADRNKLKMFRKYKFCETLENSADKDYVTEKVYIGLMAGCLPIYFGAPNVEDYVPTPESIINVRNYRNREELAAAIHALADNKTAYDERMAWRRRDPSTWSPGFQRMVQYVGDEAGYHQHNVRLCKKVHEKLASKVKMSAMDVTKTV